MWFHADKLLKTLKFWTVLNSLINLGSRAQKSPKIPKKKIWNLFIFFQPYLPPCHVFAYIYASTLTSALKTPNYKFGKGQCTRFLPRKIISFCQKKNKVCRKYQNFIRGGPDEVTNWVGGLSNQWTIIKVHHFLRGFWSSKPPESFWIR